MSSEALPLPRLAARPAARLVFVAACAAAALLYAWQARFLFLDDAFIHLRIARMLMAHGYFSFNGDFAAYCTSSPLYTTLLALADAWAGSPFVPKVLGLCAYTALFAVLARRVLAANRADSLYLHAWFLAAVASPLGIRWFTDGMETVLVALMALALARLAESVHDGGKYRPVTLLTAMAAGACATLLRIEFCFLIAMIGLASLSGFRRGGVDRLALCLGAGAAAGLFAVWMIFGGILPDTAVAKAHAARDLPMARAAADTLVVLAKTHAAASFLGASMLLLWAVSLWRAQTRDPRRGFVLTLNLALPLFVALVMWRQQAIQGIRYLVFIEFFLVVFNLAMLRQAQVRAPVHRGWLASALALVLAWQAFDFHLLRVMTDGRGASFEKFRDTDLRDLAGTPGIAWDVGFIGFFSGAIILDGHGLVNGPDVARLGEPERLRQFVQRYPVRFVFANASQLQALEGLLDLRDWETRATFDFPNVSGHADRHFLLVRR